MVAVEQNYFSLNFDFNYFVKNKKNNNFVLNIKTYIETLKQFYRLRKILKSNFNNIDTYLLLNKLNSIEKIDNVLLTLEELSEFSNEILENRDLEGLLNYPIRYMADSLEDWNMALQGLLLSKQAHL